MIVEALLAKGAGAALSALGKTKAGAEFLARIGKLKELVSLGKAKVAEAFTDEAAGLAKQKFFQRLRELGLSPNNITNLAADPELWGRALQIAGNAVSKGYTKFADFSKQITKELGEIAKPQLEKLYRESLISLDLPQGKQIISSSGKIISKAAVKEAKEKIFDLVKNNKPVELENYLTKEIRETYGKEFEKELRKTADGYVESLYDTSRRTVATHDLFGGHIDDKHIGKSDIWLRNRLNEPEMINENFVSSFHNETTANRALGKFVKENKSEIEAFLKDSRRQKMTSTFDFGESAGIVVERGKSGSKTTSNILVVLVKDNSEKGWHFLTAFPKIQ